MDDGSHDRQPLVADGVTVRPEAAWVASLRYFLPTGDLVERLSELLGGPLPGPLRTVHREVGNAGQLMLAWRRPSETLLLASDAAYGEQLMHRAAGCVDGCLVDQSGGLIVLTIAGPRACDLLVRLGSSAALPAVGDALTGRLADVTVTVIRVVTDEWVLIVERVYAAHLWAWIRETLVDFQPARLLR